jgi:hypothetical protein
MIRAAEKSILSTVNNSEKSKKEIEYQLKYKEAKC